MGKENRKSNHTETPRNAIEGVKLYRIANKMTRIVYLKWKKTLQMDIETRYNITRIVLKKCLECLLYLQIRLSAGILCHLNIDFVCAIKWPCLTIRNARPSDYSPISISVFIHHYTPCRLYNRLKNAHCNYHKILVYYVAEVHFRLIISFTNFVVWQLLDEVEIKD